MDTKIKEFCEKYIEKLKNDKDIAEVEIDPFHDSRERIDFYVTMNSSLYCHWPGLGGYNLNLLCLDKEDLKYLYEKYSKRLESEMNTNIEQLKQMYKNLGGGKIITKK